MTRLYRNRRRIAPLGQKWCNYGQHFAPEVEFTGGYCKSCTQKYREDHDHTTLAQKESRKVRKEGLDRYGGACFKCGETDIIALVIIPSSKKGVVQTIRALKALNWPEQNKNLVAYHVICHNCRHKMGLMRS